MAAANPDVLFDYDEIGRAATTMGNKLTDISNELTDLETTVSGLLQDGLVFEKASPALKDAYDAFSKQMQTSASNIGEYGKSFTDIGESIAQSDTDIANEVIKAQSESNA